MGNFFAKKNDLQLEEFIAERMTNFNIIKSNLKPFDLIFFSGTQTISNLIKYCQKKQLNIPSNDAPTIYSHVGIVITSEVLNHPKVKPNTLYILESTNSWGSEVKDIIYNESFLGVQLRELEPVIEDYYRVCKEDTVISLGMLKSHYRSIVDRFIKESVSESKFREFFDKYNHTIYDIEPFNLLGSLFKIFRQERKNIEEIISSDTFIFCSELVAMVYKMLKIYSEVVIPENVVPMDILGFDSDSLIKGGVVDVLLPLATI